MLHIVPRAIFVMPVYVTCHRIPLSRRHLDPSLQHPLSTGYLHLVKIYWRAVGVLPDDPPSSSKVTGELAAAPALDTCGAAAGASGAVSNTFHVSVYNKSRNTFQLQVSVYDKL